MAVFLLWIVCGVPPARSAGPGCSNRWRRTAIEMNVIVDRLTPFIPFVMLGVLRCGVILPRAAFSSVWKVWSVILRHGAVSLQDDILCSPPGGSGDGELHGIAHHRAAAKDILLFINVPGRKQAEHSFSGLLLLDCVYCNFWFSADARTWIHRSWIIPRPLHTGSRPLIVISYKRSRLLHLVQSWDSYHQLPYPTDSPLKHVHARQRAAYRWRRFPGGLLAGILRVLPLYMISAMGQALDLHSEYISRV